MSSSSFATISALTVLENPRKASSRTTVFDCHIWVGSPAVQKILGSVRFYSEEEAEYPDAGVYHAVIAVAKMDKDINVFSDDKSEFSFVGDIKTFSLIGDLDSPAIANLDLARRAYVTICGAYTSAFAEQHKLATEKGTVFAAKSGFPIVGHFPDIPRYKTKKPVPWAKKFVSLGGYLTGISTALEGSSLVERFQVEVDNIAFLGSFTPLASTPSSTSMSTATSDTSSSKKPRFSYTSKIAAGKRRRDDNGEGGAPTSSPSPAGPSTQAH
ncbi:hypothetical protein K438DRAFT_1976330 [Mycena galopus ATCC 62051]|nr:hypothetical protein K438DRAFT_1976330 [Mycena galopus ATCC 62051]